MNSHRFTPASAAAASVIEARFGFRVASLLSERSDALPHDVTERLKFARKQAIERLQQARAAAPVAATAASTQRNGGSLAMFGGGNPRWLGLASVLPLLALVAGLFLIQYEHSAAQILEAAEVDAELLGDDLPPSAYDDAGFVEFLKTPRN